MELQTIDDQTVHRLRAELSTFVGKMAILRERPLIQLVRLQDTCVDNERLTIGGARIRTPGLWSFPKDRWQVSTVWQFVSLDRGCWCSSFCGWSLYFNPQAIETVTSLAAGLADIEAEWQSCDNAEKRKAFFNDHDGPLWQLYMALAPALSKCEPLAGNRPDRMFP